MKSKLGDIAIIRNGQAMKESEQASEEAVRFISLKNIENEIITDNRKFPFSNINIDTTKVLLEKGDIVFPARGIKFKAMLIDNDSALSINNHIFLIRPYKEEDSKYIFWYLNTQLALKLLQSKSRGTTSTQLTLKDIKDIEIPQISIKKKNEIGSLHYKWVKQKALYKDLISCGDKTIDSFGFDLIEEEK